MAVIGAGGGVGIHLVQVTWLLGARVAGLNLTDEKLALIERRGAVAHDARDLGRLHAAFWSKGPPTVVIDFVCSPETLAWGAAALSRGGQLVAVTTTPDVQRVRPVISAVVDPSGIPSVHDQLRAGTLLGRGAVTWPTVG
ncbi:MAG: zinc-binding dehydrogenase [Chloroflexia bacterium]|nr:zinc-binding dehydrogenase [Chloroflexia bacterium]